MIGGEARSRDMPSLAAVLPIKPRGSEITSSCRPNLSGSTSVLSILSGVGRQMRQCRKNVPARESVLTRPGSRAVYQSLYG